MNQYIQNVMLFKALADVNRLMIVEMLSRGELCACRILERFNITQPTLSHHMKILCGCGLVNARKQGKWMYYSLNSENIERIKGFLTVVTAEKDDCICTEEVCDCEKPGK